ncbi:plasma-membrane choline transporter-domain-containing protein, partial [Lineolata rhizophorae]
SATDDFREEEEEREREVADYYALAKSRRQFGGSHLTESSEVDDDDDDDDDDAAGEGSRTDHGGIHEGNEGDEARAHGFGGARGIKSSWKGGKIGARGRTKGVEALDEREESDDDGKRDESVPASEKSAPSSKGKGKLVDVELESTMRDSMEELDRNDIENPDDNPPAFQKFRNPPRSPMRHAIIPEETDEETARRYPRPPSPDRESIPPGAEGPMEHPRHDAFWANLYWICLASLFATFFLVFLHTSTPSNKKPLGDTIYTTLHASFHLLSVYTLVSIIVALLWLAVLRAFVRPLVIMILVAVPILLLSFSLYPFISSFKGTWHGESVQDKAMRWLSFIPAILALLWTYTVWKGRRSLSKSTEILEFACKVLAQNPPLLFVGFATLMSVVVWSWMWTGMFTRVFLGGHLNAKNKFVIDVSTWWLGVFFVLVYLWTLAVLSAVQRCTTAATVSQWYFHRLAPTTPPSRVVVQASLAHATSTLFGTICLSTLLVLAVRLPLLVLPRRLAGLVTLAAYACVPTPIATLTNPLALTYAAVHSLPLAPAARALANMPFVSKLSPTTTLSPRAVFDYGAARAPHAKPPRPAHAASALVPYRLAKLLLHATRAVMALALGFGGWVSTARLLRVTAAAAAGGDAGPGPGPGYKGSLYAYVVGLLAAAIGWGVLGAMEGVLGGILDALVVCWASETGGRLAAEARYCREAGELFG